MRDPETRSTIEPGDFIKARGFLCMGHVLGRYEHTVRGRVIIRGWTIWDVVHGREDVIDDGSADLIHKSFAWWGLDEDGRPLEDATG